MINRWFSESPTVGNRVFNGRVVFDVVSEFFFGNKQVLRSLKNQEQAIYLTFDDGPHSEFTLRVLDVLDSENAHATFFMIAQEALAQKSVVQEVIRRGHRIGNHSLDHNHSVFFLGATKIRSWIESSEEILHDVSGSSTVGFRPPNGVLTPHVLAAAAEMRFPLYLWNRRFFDTIKTWTEERALKTALQIQSGDILLLHDRQKANREAEFLKTLKVFLKAAKQRGFRFDPLPVRGE